MSKCLNCIYFKDKDEDLPHLHVCTHKRSLYSHEELNNGIMGKHCRLWDAYIPNEATPDEVEYAQKWQDMGYHEQPDYDEYFKGLTDRY